MLHPNFSYRVLLILAGKFSDFGRVINPNRPVRRI